MVVEEEIKNWILPYCLNYAIIAEKELVNIKIISQK